MSEERSAGTPAASNASVHEVDARGLLCPLPVIRAQDAAGALARGDLLDVFATDPGTLHDIPAWCEVHGHRVVGTWHDAGDIRIRIEVCET